MRCLEEAEVSGKSCQGVVSSNLVTYLNHLSCRLDAVHQMLPPLERVLSNLHVRLEEDTGGDFDGDASAAAADSGRLLIKGNVGRKGKIYHVPEGAFYELTLIIEAKGEMWFSSEEEAVRAGWRKSKR